MSGEMFFSISTLLRLPFLKTHTSHLQKWLEDDPFLLGFGRFSERNVVSGEGSSHFFPSKIKQISSWRSWLKHLAPSNCWWKISPCREFWEPSIEIVGNQLRNLKWCRPNFRSINIKYYKQPVASNENLYFSLKLTVGPWKKSRAPKGNRIVFQPSIFRCKLWVSGRVFSLGESRKTLTF